jgi:leucyl aminopeptidase
MMSGMTVEVNNTDAEGRLVLADCLHYAKSVKPDYVVDAATLTGACVIALGEWAAGLMTEDDELASLLLQASADCGERAWRLPLWDEHRKAMEGHVADLKNPGPREGGASTAAGFLSCFTEGLRWAHLDIAGPVWVETTKPHQPRGATGFGAQLFYCFLERVAAS